MRVRKVLVLSIVCLGLAAWLFLILRALSPRPICFRGHDSRVTAVISSPDGKTLASASEDGTIKLWDVATRKERATLQGSEAVFSPDGKTLATTRYPDKVIHLWEVANGHERATLRRHADSVNAFAFSPDGKMLASGSSDKTVKLWSVDTGKEQATLRGPTDWVHAVAFSPDGRTLAAGDFTTIWLWDVGHRKERTTMRATVSGEYIGNIEWLAFSPDGQTLASAHSGGVVKLWDVGSGCRTATLDGHDENIECLVFSPDGKTLASVGIDEKIKLWDVGSGTNTATFEDRGPREPRPRLMRLLHNTLRGAANHKDTPLFVFFAADGKLMALGYDARDNTTVKMWQVAALPREQK